MSPQHKQLPDETWSAPESGTLRDDTSGNLPAHARHDYERSRDEPKKLTDDPWSAPESGTVRD